MLLIKIFWNCCRNVFEAKVKELFSVMDTFPFFCSIQYNRQERAVPEHHCGRRDHPLQAPPPVYSTLITWPSWMKMNFELSINSDPGWFRSLLQPGRVHYSDQDNLVLSCPLFALWLEWPSDFFFSFLSSSLHFVQELNNHSCIGRSLELNELFLCVCEWVYKRVPVCMFVYAQ